MKNKKFCKYFNVDTNTCEVSNYNSRCRALDGKSCPNYEKYDYEQELTTKITELEKRVHRLEEILTLPDFKVD